MHDCSIWAPLVVTFPFECLGLAGKGMAYRHHGLGNVRYESMVNI